jgi:peroxin-3
MTKVEAAVKDVFGPFNPRDDLSISKFSELVLDVRKKVEGATEEERKYVVLPCLRPVVLQASPNLSE